MPPNPDLRAGDADRERAVSRLGAHMAAGRLDAAELEDRVEAAYRARTYGELDTLLADLPAEQPVPLTKTPRRPLVPSGERLAPYRGWLLTAVVCLTVWAAVSLAAGTPGYFWPVWVIGPWGLMLFAGRGHGCGRRPHRTGGH